MATAPRPPVVAPPPPPVVAAPTVARVAPPAAAPVAPAVPAPRPNLALLLALLLLGALAWTARRFTAWGAPVVHARVSLDPGEFGTSFEAAPEARLAG